MPTNLFTPATVGALTTTSRIAMAPMTRLRAAPDGTPTPSMATYYAQRSGAGLIVAESTHATPAGRLTAGAPGLHTDAHQRAWQDIATAVHAGGGTIVVQLNHVGRMGHPDSLGPGVDPVGPSAVAAQASISTPDGWQPAVRPHALTGAQIDEIVDDFAQSARRAMAAGLDGVEVHGANGYLIHQFLSDNANLRTDSWGGTPRNRARLAREIVRAVAEAIGADRVGLRISPGNQFGGLVESDPVATYGALLDDLSGLGIAYLHLIATGDTQFDQWVRDQWPGTLMVTPRGSGHQDLLKPTATAQWLERGADLISLGRAFIANPDLVSRLRSGLPLAQTLETGVYGGDDHGYIDYPHAT